MKPLNAALVIALVFMALNVPAASAQAILTGQAGGAYYKFAVPAAWNGDLVIYNDGLTLTPIAPYTVNPAAPLAGLGPLADLQFSEGYALAATSRSTIGWAVFKSNEDLEAMMDAFEKAFRRPIRIYMTGGSLGGLVAIRAIETANLGNIVGGLLMCPALAGSRNQDLALDLRLIYDTICSDVVASRIPGGAEGLPAGFTPSPTELAAAVNQCTGVLLPAAARTPVQQARLNKILSLTKIPESSLLTDMGYATFVLSDLVHDPEKLNGRIGTGNSRVDYGDPETNISIERVTADPFGRRRLAENYTPTGRVRNTPIVSIHTDKDGLVIVENQDDYAAKAPRSLFTSAVATEQVPSHCGFNAPEVVGAWESLRGWVGGRRQPTPDSIQEACEQASRTFSGECRFYPKIDLRIRPRNP